MDFFTRRQDRIKDGKWFQGGWLAYLLDYYAKPMTAGRGANYWIRGGFTELEAINALKETFKADKRGQNLADGYWMIIHGLVPELEDKHST